MTQTELFTTNLGPLPVGLPQSVPEAVATGHASPEAANPFLWSSDMWEAFNLGQYLRKLDISPEGFRKSRGSSYVNKSGLIVKYHYEGASWFLMPNRCINGRV